MLKKVAIIFGLMGLSLYNAQSFKPILRSYSVNSTEKIQEQENLKILAVMVEFQSDDFSLTYGDGKFGSIYSKEYGTDIIDPLPHNSTYFEDHLKFAKNYYQKVSKGKVDINYTVLPNIITVSKPMRDYSPVGDESFKILADFSKEVWELADANNPNFDFSQYNVFVIFHAGAGKDISTSDLFGEARDLPSIYLGLNSLKEFYGESFNGFMTSNTFITNSIILPETESREESGIGGVTLIELSINGLIVSSLASHMGLPDLFDSETGKSAIGRFGLMDGQSLFAFAGLFPPEPSAWEKIFLGWESPTIVSSNTTNIKVFADQIAVETDSKIIKVPINSTEYYLIENRSRDANKDGITITYKVGGESKIINFDEDLDNFNNAFVDTLKGVVTDVDEFDWAIPGNGILIWHIDEKIINENLLSNRINVGKNRGVDLEEADGVQDIGEEFQTIFGDIIIAEGDEFDFWYSGNTSELYTNKFGLTTKPNTQTNSGANSLITFSNFSSIGNQMSFDIIFGTENISLLDKFEIDPNLRVKNYKIISNSAEKAAYFSSDNNLLRVGNGIQQIDNFSSVEFAMIENGNEQIIIGGIDNHLNLVSFNVNDSINFSIETKADITSPIVLAKNGNNIVNIFVGLADGSVEKYSFNSNSKEIPILEETYNLFQDKIAFVTVLDNEVISASEKSVIDINNNLVSLPNKILQIALTKDKHGNYVAVILTEDNSIYTLYYGSSTAELIYSNNNQIENFALADLKNDGENYIVFNLKNEIHALNLSGSEGDNFPFKSNSSIEFVSFPIIVDLDSDNQQDILSTSEDGSIYAISGKYGTILTGFPLSIGGSFSGNQTVTKEGEKISLSVGSKTNDFYLWEINSSGNIDWSGELGNNFNSTSLGLAKTDNFISTFFPKNRTYNWPNPAYGNETFIRTYVAEDSQVDVKIFDLAGDLVDKFNFFAVGGIDSEVSWKLNKIQSGAYLAHLEVKSNSGKTDSKIIKIAVIK